MNSSQGPPTLPPPDVPRPVVSPELEAMVRAVVDRIRGVMPHEVDAGTAAAGVFGMATLARMASVLHAELELATGDDWDTARLVGRSIKELWLYAQYLAFAGDEALEKLVAEQTRADER